MFYGLQFLFLAILFLLWAIIFLFLVTMFSFFAILLLPIRYSLTLSPALHNQQIKKWGFWYFYAEAGYEG